jgi:beta-glucosidase
MTYVTPPGAPLTFPAGFTWGAATAAYQIEGATDADGRGLSVWDTFSRTPGKVRGDDTGDIACDSYRRYPEDADLLGSLGLSSYRFSISWPRIFPDGAGRLNQAGLDHYKALLEALAERGVGGAATLFHWDLPQALQDQGGWASRDIALRFADYAAAVAGALGDRVERWITLNEPLVVSHLGYRTGIHAPGLADEAAAAAATHHLLLGHGLATAALRASVPAAQVGITLNLTPVLVAPHGNGSADLLERARLVADATHNGVFLEPLLHGRYPEHAPAAILPPAELVRDGDMAAISAPVDFLGVNYYRPQHLRAGDPANLRLREFPPVPGTEGDVVEYYPQEMELTNMDWLIDPDGLYQLLLGLAADAPGLPLYITENGRAAEDYLNPAGQVDDRERVKFLHQHLDACARAVRDGVNLRGYYVWSLLDNFEWAYGYQKRFGIVYVDFPTGRRTPKASAAFYSRVALENAVPPLPASWPA